jgi:hypothetical protein
MWEVDAPVATALLLTSELVTNAVKFAVAPFEVCLRIDEAILRLEVRDRSDGTPGFTIRPRSRSGVEACGWSNNSRPAGAANPTGRARSSGSNLPGEPRSCARAAPPPATRRGG